MLTVFRILFGENTKIGNRLAIKGSSLSFFKQNNDIKTVAGALPLLWISLKQDHQHTCFM